MPERWFFFEFHGGIPNKTDFSRVCESGECESYIRAMEFEKGSKRVVLMKFIIAPNGLECTNCTEAHGNYASGVTGILDSIIAVRDIFVRA